MKLKVSQDDVLKAASWTASKAGAAPVNVAKGSKASWAFLKALGSAIKGGAKDGYQKAKQQS